MQNSPLNFNSGNSGYTYPEGELIETILGYQKSRKGVMWWWFRYVILQAQERGYVKVLKDSDDKPFHILPFDEAIELTPKLTEIVERNKRQQEQRESQEKAKKTLTQPK